MSESYRIDHQRRIVWSRSWGVLCDADLLGQLARVKTEPNFESNYSQLIDTTAVTRVTLSAAVVREVAQNSNFAPEAKRAFLVKQDIVFGFGRMFQLYQGLKGGSNTQVFRDRAQALAWLGVEDDENSEPAASSPQPSII